MNRRIEAIIILLVMSLSISCMADIIVFTNGQRQDGLILEEDQDGKFITFLSSTGEMKIPQSRIARITRESTDMGYYHIANGYFKMGNLTSAWENIQKALDINPDNSRAEELRNTIRETREEKAREELKAQSLRIQESLEMARTLITENKFNDALELIETAEEAGLSDEQQQIAKQIRTDLYYQWGLNSLDHLDNNGAITHFQKVLELEPDHEGAFDELLTLWENQPGRNPELIAIYKKRYEKNPGNLDLARKLADLYYKQKQFREALPYLLEIKKNSKVPTPTTDRRIKEVMGMEISDAERGGDYEKASELYDRYLKLVPEADPTPKYYYQYLSRIEKLDDDDYEGHIELGNFARKYGMDSLAKERFRYVLEKQPENENARQGLLEYARKDLAEAEMSFRNKEYDATLYLSNKVISEYSNLNTIVARSRELQERAQNEIRKEQRAIAERAISLVRRGDEYRSMAQMHINALMSEDRKTGITIISDRQKARQYLERAINMWEAALKINPALARPDEEDLNFKLREARADLRNLSRIVPFPDTFRTPR